jgi:KUP system potassium uptake protein
MTDGDPPAAAGETPLTAADEPGRGPHGRPPRPPRHAARTAGAAALTLGALGVVFGDIGTSPLYALQTVFSADGHAVKATQSDVYGVISLVFWSITMIVSVKFVTFIMRADNDGEGGIMALIALVMGAALKNPRRKALLVAIGLFGVALFYGDGMITPAVSVLSAVEGLEVVSSSMSDWIVPITIAILTALFAIQHYGTHVVGRLFGPVMVVWFVVIAFAGVAQIASSPDILRTLSPTYAVDFFFDHPGVTFIALGSVVLAVTGAEALYADMGHFGRRPITRAWFLLVFPALTLNYMGQGSLILEDPSAIANPFFLLVPEWARLPLVLLATVATVIASQAVISGAFSVTRQAVTLGFLPRLAIRHTSPNEVGQVYASSVNWALFVAVVVLVVGFGSSAKLASAYGIAVTGTLTIDTVLFLVVVRALWKKPLWLAVAGGAVFLTIDLMFLAANLTKVLHGGWFPLLVGVVVFVVLTTWARGRAIVTSQRTIDEGLLRDFVADLDARRPPVPRVPGTAVYLNSRRETTPLALRASVTHNHVIHESVVVVTVLTTKVPWVEEADRLVVEHVGRDDDGIAHLTARFGFQDTPDVPAALRLACATDLEGTKVDSENASYFLSEIDIVPTRKPGLARWRKRLFVALGRNAASPVEYFRLPRDRTVILGSQVEL